MQTHPYKCKRPLGCSCMQLVFFNHFDYKLCAACQLFYFFYYYSFISLLCHSTFLERRICTLIPVLWTRRMRKREKESARGKNPSEQLSLALVLILFLFSFLVLFSFFTCMCTMYIKRACVSIFLTMFAQNFSQFFLSILKQEGFLFFILFSSPLSWYKCTGILCELVLFLFLSISLHFFFFS